MMKIDIRWSRTVNICNVEWYLLSGLERELGGHGVVANVVNTLLSKAFSCGELGLPRFCQLVGDINTEVVVFTMLDQLPDDGALDPPIIVVIRFQICDIANNDKHGART